jgi:serine/arginine repetitive matrix protein 1
VIATQAAMASAGDARLMKSTKFPTEFSQKVDMQKVNLQVIKKFVTGSQDALSWTPDFPVLTANLTDGLPTEFPRFWAVKTTS